jgi:hypothetical protein
MDTRSDKHINIIYNSDYDDDIHTKFESNPQYERIKKIISDIEDMGYEWEKHVVDDSGKKHVGFLNINNRIPINKKETRARQRGIMSRVRQDASQHGGGIPTARPISRQQTLGTCGTVSDLDRVSSNSRYNFFVEIWCFLLKVSGTSDRNLCNKPIRMDTNRFNYTFSFNGFIIILRVNTKPSPDGCSQTAYSIIINITPHDIHFTLFYNIYRNSSGNRCRSDESSALHITVVRAGGDKYRLYIPWEYVSNSGNDAREFFISSIYKISYYLLAKKTCNGIDITQLDSRTLNYDNLITSISSLPSAVGYPVRTDVAGKMKQLAIDLAGELNDFYRSCASPRTFDISNQCPPHTGGNKKISKKLERYLLKQKEYINKLKLLRKNKLKNKVKIIKQNKLLKNLKIKIKKEKAKAKEKLKKQKAKEKLKKQKEKEKLKKVHIAKKLKNKK